ncbi:MAG: acetylxylan esterase [Planctomycetes bacterium]|nr:acetylxylan esterase [Planctomycetota bacterium]
MKKRFVVFFLLVCALSCAIAQAAKPKTSAVRVVTDRADAIYKVGEKATFEIAAKDPAAAEVAYSLSLDGGEQYDKGTLTLQDGKASVAGTLKKPGILRCTVVYTAAGKKRDVAYAGAAYDPFEIEPTAAMPKDFDRFWKKQKALLAKVKMDAKLEPSSASNDQVEIYKITLANVNGSRVHGYFGRPKQAKRCPAILTVPAAGVYSITPGWVSGWAAKGFIAMGISAHDIPNDQPKEFYDKLKAGDLKTYSRDGRDDRKTYYFYRVFLGVVRAVDYLTSRPEWDGTHMIINGSSQGGGLSIIGAGLDDRITALAANVPALCDHSGANYGRPSGWPRLVPKGPDGKLDPKILKVSEYYDAVNFARRIGKKVPAVFGVGLIDRTCPAMTVFSAYNVLKGKKQIDIAPLMGHAHNKTYMELKNRFILQRAGFGG